MPKSYRDEPTTGEMIASTTRLASTTADRLATVEQRFNERLNVLEQRNRRTAAAFTSFGEYLLSIRRASEGRTEPRLEEFRAAGINGTGAPDDGSFLIPTDFSTTLADMIFYAAPLAARCMPIPAERRTISLPAIDEVSRANGSRFGGVQSAWVDEATAFPLSKPKFRTVDLSLNKLAAACYVTDELSENGAALGTFVASAFAAEAAYVLDTCIMSGAGVGQPLGLLNSPALITVAKQQGQVAGTIVAANITDMLARLLPECLQTAVWLISTEMLAALYGTYAPAGSGGVAPTPMITPADAGAPFGRLLSRPVLPVEQANSIGSVGDIVLADLSKYVIYSRPLSVALSMHVRFINGENVYRFGYRLDGAPIVKSPITPRNGGPTKSAFVAVAAR